MNNCEFFTSLSPTFISKYVPDTAAANALIGTTVYFVMIVGIVCKRVRHLLTGLELTLLWGLGLLSTGTEGFYCQVQTTSSGYKMKPCWAKVQDSRSSGISGSEAYCLP